MRHIVQHKHAGCGVVADLSDKRKSFVREYLKAQSASVAASLADVETSCVPPVNGYYVYALINPETDRIIYIGKGKGRRMFTHVREAKGSNIPTTSLKKYKALRDLVEAGITPVETVLFCTDTEGEAYRLERGLISGIGLKNLSNSVPGAMCPAQRDKLRAEIYKSKIMPKRAWLQSIKGTWRDKPQYHEMYDLIVAELDKTIANCIEAIEGRMVYLSDVVFINGKATLKNNQTNQNG